MNNTGKSEEDTKGKAKEEAKEAASATPQASSSSSSQPKRHFTLLIDKSGSMTTRDCPNGRSRWELAKDAAKAFAQVCCTFDADHTVDVFFFGSRGKDEHMAVRSGSDIEARFARGPTEGTYLAGCLQKAIELVPYDQLHTIMVITDGEASDKGPLEKVLVEASHKIARDECLAISFIQVGQDKGARRFLKMLDDDLTGCKFDIVDTKACRDSHSTAPPHTPHSERSGLTGCFHQSCDEVAQIGLIETLRQAITD
ncbi:von Willebrand factor, type A, putative [Acanthamoeba castellanii str. Neff]|uniref:von Willebrand factor, type A, putative n=1 Tax=Acanthamoeba castellanii (strain ATCC 30010 / Neff) TaxID=1257118 RepID=L8GND4_ACACF|nr:von Willebrand factor, type A, putative [Acanthamoeba castellanii str. Neff]ELR14258.1 von Willebrand factor, type A, putative [Acanthamoeba castellanii str. Neff]